MFLAATLTGWIGERYCLQKLTGVQSINSAATNDYTRNYLHQRSYVVIVVCLFICLLATLCKNFLMDLHEIFREGWQ